MNESAEFEPADFLLSTMSQVKNHACMKFFIWRMGNQIRKVDSSRRQPTTRLHYLTIELVQDLHPVKGKKVVSNWK